MNYGRVVMIRIEGFIGLMHGNTLYKQKEVGCMGFREVEALNEALLATQLWRPLKT